MPAVDPPGRGAAGDPRHADRSRTRRSRIKVAGRIQGLNNGLTNQKGMLEGLVKGGSLGAEGEAARRSWPPGSPPTRPGRRSTATCCRRCRRCRPKARRPASATPRSAGLSAPRPTSARRRRSTGCRSQRPKSDLDRDPGFQERDWSRIREGQERLQRTLDPTADRALLRWAMGMAAALPADQRIEPLDKPVGLRAGHGRRPRPRRRSTRTSTRCTPGTKLADRDFRLGLLEKSTAELAGDQGLVHRAGRGARAARRSRSARPARTARAPTPGCGRATWRRCWPRPAAWSRPTPTARCA